MIRILLADDHTLFRHGLRRMLEDHDDFSVVGEASSGLEAVELADRLMPDIAILDIGMSELNGVEATAQIVRKSPKTAVLILSMHSDERYVARAMKAGARGYLLKDSAEEAVKHAIRAIHRGERYYSPSVTQPLEEQRLFRPGAAVEDRYELLTERERQLYQMLAEGKSNKEIAARLNLSLHTVETHRARIMEKLGLHSIAELVLAAVKRGHVLPE